MGNNFGSNNDLINMLQSTVMNDSWLSEMYGQQRADQQSELKKIFTVVSGNNINESQKDQLIKRRGELQEQVERLEAKMAVLEEELAKNQSKIDKLANELTSLIAGVGAQTEQMEKDHEKYVKAAINDVFSMYRRNKIGKDEISSEIYIRIKGANLTGKSSKIEEMLNKISGKNSEIQGLVNDASIWLDERNLLETRYGITKSTYDLLNSNIQNIGALEKKYTNSDYNATIPLYSPEKTATISELFQDENLNVAPTNNLQQEGATKGTLDSVQEKYAQYFNVEKTGSDEYSSSNKAVVALGKALDEGLLTDLANTNLPTSAIQEFLSTNFKTAGLKFNDKGKFVIPIGHGNQAQKIYKQVNTFFEDRQNNPFLGVPNTWGDAGNTISSNNQLKALSENYGEILNKLKPSVSFDEQGNKTVTGFTFKEAMFALFNPDTGLFKNCGIKYNPEEQNGKPSYTIERGGDEETANFYKNLSDKIYTIWGVRPELGDEFETYDVEDNTVRVDPLSFNYDGAQYTLAFDRNKDGKFNVGKDENGEFNSSEFIGGKGNWLEDLKSLDTNNDGKIEGDELKELKLIKTNFKDNAETKFDGDFLREETTTIGYSITNAKEFGMHTIVLRDENDPTKGIEATSVVNSDTGFNDINGSDIYNDSFKLTTDFANGDDALVVTRKDDSKEYLSTVFDGVKDAKYQLGMSENEVNEIIEKDYGEYDEFANKYGTTFDNIAILKNANRAGVEARNLFDKALDRIDRHEKTELAKAGNKAASYTYGTSWETEMQDNVVKEASRQGVSINMEQAKGMYILDKSLSAQKIVEKCLELQADTDDIANEKAIAPEAWKVLNQALKSNIKFPEDINISDEILGLLKKGELKSTQEVVDYLKEKYGENDVAVNVSNNEIGFSSEREKEIYEAFNQVFNNANLPDRVVDSQVDLCRAQRNNMHTMINTNNESVDATELANRFLQKYL